MVSSEIERGAREFADYFFNGVISRLRAAGAPDREYALPQIFFTPQRSREEESEFRDKYSEMEDAAQAIVDSMEPEQLSDMPLETFGELVNEELGYDWQEYLNVYCTRVSHGSLGTYYPSSDILYMDQDNFRTIADYGTLAHELLHAIRNKVTDKEETNLGYSELSRYQTHSRVVRGIVSVDNVVSAELIEFFSQLDDIIVSSVCSRSSRYRQVAQALGGSKLDLTTLWQYHDYFEQGVHTRVIELTDRYKAAMRNLRKMLENGNLPAIRADIEGYEATEECANKMIRGFAYLNLVMGLGGETLDDIMKTIQTLLNSFSDPDLVDDPEFMVLSTNLSWSSAIGRNRITGMQDKHRPYYLSKVAIGQARKELQKNWPRAFLMDGRKAEKKYIRPVERALRWIGYAPRSTVERDMQRFFRHIHTQKPSLVYVLDKLIPFDLP